MVDLGKRKEPEVRTKRIALPLYIHAQRFQKTKVRVSKVFNSSINLKIKSYKSIYRQIKETRKRNIPTPNQILLLLLIRDDYYF